MRTVICRDFGPLSSLRVEELPDLEPGPGEVVFELVVDGRINGAIDRTFGLAEAGDALQYVKDGKARGKVVITTGLG
ncbi:zinc-binding dehydrogenase [Streptosporangium sp. NPDC051023]|uniref:zinc-binding dehydrogenase n=1 Tax=Streptosporangium sp. NPDC051023 TaxID=3155410 RepID=UPI00344BA0C5